MSDDTQPVAAQALAAVTRATTHRPSTSLGELLLQKLREPPCRGTTELGRLLRAKLDAQPKLVQHSKRTFYPAAHPSAVDLYEVKA